MRKSTCFTSLEEPISRVQMYMHIRTILLSNIYPGQLSTTSETGDSLAHPGRSREFIQYLPSIDNLNLPWHGLLVNSENSFRRLSLVPSEVNCNSSTDTATSDGPSRPCRRKSREECDRYRSGKCWNIGCLQKPILYVVGLIVKIDQG